MGCGTSKMVVIPEKSNMISAHQQPVSSVVDILPKQSPFTIGHQIDEAGLIFKEQNLVNKQYNIVFHIKEGNLEAVKECIANGISINHIGMWGNSPLIVACQYNKADVATYLLSFEGIQVSHVNEKQAGALVYAAIEGMTSISKMLIEKGAQIDVPPAKIYSSILDKSIECTPMSAAIIHGHDETVALFLDSGFPLDHIFQFNILKSLQIANTIVTSTSLQKENKSINLLLYACFCGQLVVVNDLLLRGINIEYKDQYQSTFIHYSCRSMLNTDELLQSLISPYTTTMDNLNQTDSFGNTPLHILCTQKNINSVKLFLEYGANPNLKDKDGNTALHIAIKYKSILATSALLNSEIINIYIKNNRGLTCVDLSKSHRNDSKIRLMIEEYESQIKTNNAPTIERMKAIETNNHNPPHNINNYSNITNTTPAITTIIQQTQLINHKLLLSNPNTNINNNSNINSSKGGNTVSIRKNSLEKQNSDKSVNGRRMISFKEPESNDIPENIVSRKPSNTTTSPTIILASYPPNSSNNIITTTTNTYNTNNNNVHTLSDTIEYYNK